MSFGPATTATRLEHSKPWRSAGLRMRPAGSATGPAVVSPVSPVVSPVFSPV